jgi:hypothetical protein
VLLYRVPRSLSHFDARYWKTQIGLISPFRNNIYLDCDVIATSNADTVWDEVRQGEIGLASDIFPTLFDALGRPASLEQLSGESRRTAEIAGFHVPYHNGGIVIWKDGDTTREFFALWHEEWKLFWRYDQFALARALARSSVRIRCLRPQLNCRADTACTLPDAMHSGMTFVHFWDNKAIFDRFATQLRTLKQIRERVRATEEQTAADQLLCRTYDYNRVGYDRRPMEFLSDGTIGTGSAGCELFWDLRAQNDSIMLKIFSDEELTCTLVMDALGSWRGNWIQHEKMPIILSPLQ